MKRTGFTTRSAPHRKTAMRTVNRKRKAANHERAYGGQARLDWTHAQPCYHCGRRAGEYRTVVPAHIKNGGLSRKSDARFTIPLCETPSKHGCHDAQHQHGWIVLPFLCTRDQREAAAAEVEERWQSHLRQTGRAPNEDNGND